MWFLLVHITKAAGAEVPSNGDQSGGIKQQIEGQSDEIEKQNENRVSITELLNSSHAHELNGGWLPSREMDARVTHELRGAYYRHYELDVGSRQWARSSV